MISNGVYQAVRDRSAAAEPRHINIHRFRHTFTHQRLTAGEETGFVRLIGQRSRSMVGRRGASVAAERAREADKRLGLGNLV